MSDRPLLNAISSPTDVKALSASQAKQLVNELRDFIVEVVAEKGGHLGASLGVVELTVALLRVLNLPDDNLVWDVGHQSYGYKILTQRKDRFSSIRQKGGLSGFPSIKESKFDHFGTGHSSTSISAILGMALVSREANKKHVAVIGDASIQAGMALEALNHAGVAGKNILVVLNDNHMSIDPSVGALNHYFNTKDHEHSSASFFEAFNFSYSGPIDGHDLALVEQCLKHELNQSGPRILHIKTTKGKGYKPAEYGNPTQWHAPGLFNKSTGKVLASSPNKLPKFQEVFGEALVGLAEKHDQLFAITPAMPTGSSVLPMMQKFPGRAIDVGIAEQHAVTLAAGIAKEGGIPIVAIYSTFLQRGYDQLIHDVALQNLKVIFAIDRAGLVGADGPTHHGAFDLAYLNCIPNMTIAAPMNGKELRAMLKAAVEEWQGPIGIRYPRGRVTDADWKEGTSMHFGKSELRNEGEKVAILSIGTIGIEVENALAGLKKQGVNPTWINMRFLKPLDQKALHSVFTSHTHIITVEDGTMKGGLYSEVLSLAAVAEYTGKIEPLALPDVFITHGTQSELYEDLGLNAEGIARKIGRIFDSR